LSCHISCVCVPCAMPLLHCGHPHSGCGQLLARSTIFVGPNFPEELPFSLCHFLHGRSPSSRLQTASHPKSFTSDTHWIGGLVGPGAGLNLMIKKIPHPVFL
jgi:hypothetical protein